MSPHEARAVLSAALHAVLGADASVESWTAEPLKRGKGRVVRYDVRARVAGGPRDREYCWVIKRYEGDAEGRRAAAILDALAGTDCAARGGLVIPRVLTYEARHRALVMTYERGESATAAIARAEGVVLPAIARALAALHATRISLEGVAAHPAPAVLLADARRRIADLGARFPGEEWRRRLRALERHAPPPPAAPAFLHGDLGAAQLLWRDGEVVVLDFDAAMRGDPALDLGNLLTQLRRITLRKPGKLPAFGSIRATLLGAYRGRVPPDPGLGRRVAWYERATFIRKMHALACDGRRRHGADRIGRRHVEEHHAP